MEHNHNCKYLNFCQTVLPKMLITTPLDSFMPSERNVFYKHNRHSTREEEALCPLWYPQVSVLSLKEHNRTLF